jgi:hypothetical protein
MSTLDAGDLSMESNFTTVTLGFQVWQAGKMANKLAVSRVVVIVLMLAPLPVYYLSRVSGSLGILCCGKRPVKPLLDYRPEAVAKEAGPNPER